MRLAIAAFTALFFSLSVHAADEPKPDAATRAEAKRQADAERAAAEKRKRAELEAQCVIKPVMSDAEIDKCRAASR